MEYYPALTGLRSVGAFFVFCHHFYGQWFPDRTFPGYFLAEGYIGVSIFFTLSGFLITRTYMSKLKSGSIGFREYWTRRFARVYPVYLVLLTWKLSFRPDLVKSGGQLIANFTLSQALFQSFIWTGIAPAWSLTVEESFYLLAPLIFLTVGRKPLPQAFVILIALTAVFWFSGDVIHWLGLGTDFLANLDLIHRYSLFGRFGEFALGVFAGFATAKILPEKIPISGEGALIFGLLLIGSSLGLLAYFREHFKLAFGISSEYGIVASALASVGTLMLILAALKKSVACHFLFGNRCTEYFGRISYVFYLIQDRFFSETLMKIWNGEFIPIFISLSVLALVVYEFVEKPLHHRVIRALTSGKNVSVAPSSPELGKAVVG